MREAHQKVRQDAEEARQDEAPPDDGVGKELKYEDLSPSQRSRWIWRSGNSWRRTLPWGPHRRSSTRKESRGFAHAPLVQV